MTKATKPVTCHLPALIKDELDRRAADLNLTTAALVRRIIRSYLNGQSRQEHPDHRGVPGVAQRGV
jgi:hypothetical protein